MGTTFTSEKAKYLDSSLDAPELIKMVRQINVSAQRVCAAGNVAREDQGAKIAQLIYPSGKSVLAERS
jgi:hypothetical protein